MKQIVKKEVPYLVEKTTGFSELTVEEGAVLTAPEGKVLTLTVDGVHRDLAPGTYRGNVVLSVTEPVRACCENHGQTEWFSMNAAVSVRDGKYCPQESVAAAVQRGTPGDGQAHGLTIRSEGDYLGGIYVDGDGTYEIHDADIALQGHGASDAIGYGAGIAVRGNASVTIHRAKIHNVGSIRTALQVCGHGKVTVFDSEFSAADDQRPNYVKAMSKAPWMLGIHGRVRTTNIQEYGEVTYHRCKVSAQNWGAMSTDGTQHVRLSMYDSEVTVSGSGYGAYSIGDCHDFFSGCTIRVPDYGVIQCGGGSMVTYTDGTLVEAGRNAVMMHGSGEPGLLTIDKKSRLRTGGAVIQIKGRGGEILVDDAQLHSDKNVLLEILDNDDPNGRGMHMGPDTVMDVPPGGFPDGGVRDTVLEAHGGPDGPGGPGVPGGPGGAENRERMEAVFPVHARLQNGSYTGDVFHCYPEKQELELTLHHASLAGRITTGVASHPAGMPKRKEEYDRIGRVELFACPRDAEFGVTVELKDHGVWNVTETSYITTLRLDETCRVQGQMTVNGVRTSIVPGNYVGKIVLHPI